MEKWMSLLAQIALPSTDQRTFIWGGGNTSRLAHQGMVRENLYEALHIVGYLDKKTAGSTLNGFPVHHPSVLESFDKKQLFVLISTAYPSAYHEISSALTEMGIAHCSLDSAIFKINLDKIIEVCKLFDNTSRHIFCRLIEKRISLEPVEEELYCGESYFGIPEFCRQYPNEVILDCGAYVGDTAERFLWRIPLVNKIICIEPEEGNYIALCKRLKRLREEWNCSENGLIPIRGGVDFNTKKCHIANNGNSLAALQDENKEHGDETTYWALDDLVALNSWGPVTLIKADIESYEYRAILGAKGIIKRYHPRLAICIYHSAIDMYSIPLLIHDLFPEYKLSVRHHSYGLLETVLYAHL